MDTIEIDEFTKNRLVGILNNIYALKNQAAIICETYVLAKEKDPKDNYILSDDCSQLTTEHKDS